MNDIDKILAYNNMEAIKEAPPFMQLMNLMIFTKLDPTGTSEPLARILNKYGVSAEKIMPCIMDIMELYLMNDKVEDSNDTD